MSASDREAFAERQRLAQEAWQRAEHDGRQKVDILRRQQGSALMEQLREYKRCRKCHKAISSSKVRVFLVTVQVGSLSG